MGHWLQRRANAATGSHFILHGGKSTFTDSFHKINFPQRSGRNGKMHNARVLSDSFWGGFLDFRLAQLLSQLNRFAYLLWLPLPNTPAWPEGEKTLVDCQKLTSYTFDNDVQKSVGLRDSIRAYWEKELDFTP